MRRLLAVLLSVLFLCGAAVAETPARTRTSVLMTEGIETEFIETFYAGETFTLWYPADLLTPSDYYGNVSFVPVDEDAAPVSFMLVPTEVPVEESAAFIAEATGGYGSEWAVSDVRDLVTENGNPVLSVEAVGNGEVHRFYLVQGFANCLCITAIFPAEAAEGFGARFDAMAKTIGF